MNTVLLAPLGLAALAALVLPVVIHIARRSEQRPTAFAALRWLSERPRPRARLRIDERLLLVLRLLLVALVAVLLARPAVTGTGAERGYLAVVPGADPGRSGIAGDRLRRAHWLSPGFPAVDRDPPPRPLPGTSLPVDSLLRELDAGLAPGVELTVIAPAILQGADGARPRLSRPVRWIVTPGAMAERGAVAAPPLRLALRHDPAHAAEARYVRAAVEALGPQAAAADPGDPVGPLPQPPVVLVRLAQGPLPEPVQAFVRAGGTVLLSTDAAWPADAGPAIVVWADPAGAPLVEARGLGSGRLLRFARALRPAELPALLEGDFPARLATVLRPPPPGPARVFARDHAPLSGGPAGALPPVTDLRPWLALLIAAVWLAERWVATRRDRAAGP